MITRLLSREKDKSKKKQETNQTKPNQSKTKGQSKKN